MSMGKLYQYPRSHLFTVRVWQEVVGDEQVAWRGKVHLITDGNVRYFHEWEALVPLLLAMLSEVEILSEPNT